LLNRLTTSSKNKSKRTGFDLNT